MLSSSNHRFRLRMVVPKYPAFNIYTRTAKTTTALGPVCVATAVNKMAQWDVEVIDENNLGRYGPRAAGGAADHEFLQKQRPAHVVGLYGGMTSSVPRLFEIAKFYKQRGVVTIAGGQHFVPETIPEALGQGIDYIVLGEGERSIKQLLEAIQSGRDVASVRGIVYLKDGKPFYTEPTEPLNEFDDLPLPEFSLVRYANIKLFPVERIRGCGMNCEFCTVKGRPRAASPGRLVQQISRIVETYKARRFFIVDDLFGQRRQETLALCEQLADYQQAVGVKLRIAVQIRLDKARDQQLLAAMRRAGIRVVCIGFESPIDQELQAMNKQINAADMLDWVKVFRKHGFLIHGMFIFCYPLKESAGFDMSLDERVKRYRKFIRKARIDTVQIMLAAPLPGTELRQRLQEQNRIYPRSHLGWQYYDGSFPLFEPDAPLGPERVHAGARRIMGGFYRFEYMFLVPLNILSFPSVILFFYNIRRGWSRWYRCWRNYLLRFGGWIVLRRWTEQLRKDRFMQKLQTARRHRDPGY